MGSSYQPPLGNLGSDQLVTVALDSSWTGVASLSSPSRPEPSKQNGRKIIGADEHDESKTRRDEKTRQARLKRSL